MFFQKTALLAFLASSLVAAVPAPTEVKLPATPEGLVILDQRYVGKDILVIYGDVDLHGADGQKLKGRSLPPMSELEKRQCGSNDLFCSRNYIPTNTCVVQLYSDINLTYRDTIPEAPRSICRSSSTGGFCCVSWAHPARGAVRNNLLAAMQKAQYGCVLNGQSGLTRNTNLGGTCTTQCLSSDANTCR